MPLLTNCNRLGLILVALHSAIFLELDSVSEGLGVVFVLGADGAGGFDLREELFELQYAFDVGEGDAVHSEIVRGVDV